VLIVLRKPTGQLVLLSVIAPTIARPDIAQHFGNTTTKALGFSGNTPISMAAQGLIEAWAVNTTTEVAWPLAGTWRLPP
jgi:hypothetical protein